MATAAETRTEREEALLEDYERLNAQMAELEAQKAEVLAERFDLLLEDDPLFSPQHDAAVRSLVSELAAAGHVSQTVAETQMCRAHTLVHRYPELLRALRDGAITVRHVEVIIQAGSVLDSATEAQRAEFELRALEYAIQDAPGRTAAAAKMLAAAIAPKTVAERHRTARERRGVFVRDLDDGMAQAVITGSALLIRAAVDRATQTAKQIIAQRPVVGPAEQDADTGLADTRTMDQIRSDIALELLLGAPLASVSGTPAESIHAAVQVTISAAALAGLDDGMAEFDGFGPVLAEDVRFLAACQTGWTRLLIDADGTLLATDAYTPKAAMKRFLRARDQRCRFPGCRRPARRCDIDHNHDHAKGGRTDVGNLSCLCRGHHSLKHPDLLDRHRWSVRQLPGGVIAWISPAGSTYIDEPPRAVAFT